MSDMNDYQLEEMENSQIKKAGAAKKAAILAAGGLGLTTTGAFAADRLGDMTNDESTEGVLTEDDLIHGADAASLEEPAPAAPAPAPAAPVAQAPAPEPVQPIHDPEVIAGESGIAFDADGNLVAQYDSGTVDGDQYVVMDTDFNGKGDLIAIDVNHNGQIENNEIVALDNQSYIMGTPNNVVIIDDVDSQYPDPHPITQPDVTDIDDIHNDFFDETTGEEYRQDLADNNPDYNNHGDTDYYAANNTEVDDPFDPDAPLDPMTDYDNGNGYDDLADNGSYDDTSADDAFIC